MQKQYEYFARFIHLSVCQWRDFVTTMQEIVMKPHRCVVKIKMNGCGLTHE